jgi:hypothetical protein
MKVYAHWFGTIEPDGSENKIAYTIAPESTWTHREAETLSQLLNRKQTHVGEHYCHFIVEALPEDKFAIVCEEHPDDTIRSFS